MHLARFLVVLVLRLDFAGKLKVLRTKFLPGTLHGIEASALSLWLLRRLRSAFVSFVWSRRMPLAHVGAVLTLLDGPVGCVPAFILCGAGLDFSGGTRPFGLLRCPGYIAFWTWLLLVVLGMGPCHLLVQNAGVLGFA